MSVLAKARRAPNTADHAVVNHMRSVNFQHRDSKIFILSVFAAAASISAQNIACSGNIAPQVRGAVSKLPKRCSLNTVTKEQVGITMKENTAKAMKDDLAVIICKDFKEIDTFLANIGACCSVIASSFAP